MDKLNLSRGIPNLVELMNPMQKLLKKYAKFEWSKEGRESFKSIKDVISISPIVISHDYSKYF